MAEAAAKVAISLDTELLARAERLRKQTGESRSALVARALRGLLHAEERERQIAQYVDGYRRVPETIRDAAVMRKLARRAVAIVPWDNE